MTKGVMLDFGAGTHSAKSKCILRICWMILGTFIAWFVVTWFMITMLHFNDEPPPMGSSSHHITTVTRRTSNDLPILASTKEDVAGVKVATVGPKVAAPKQRAAAPNSSKLKSKQEQVVNSMREIWRNYKAHAWGYDELKLQSQQGYPRGRAKCSKSR